VAHCALALQFFKRVHYFTWSTKRDICESFSRHCVAFWFSRAPPPLKAPRREPQRAHASGRDETRCTDDSESSHDASWSHHHRSHTRSHAHATSHASHTHSHAHIGVVACALSPAQKLIARRTRRVCCSSRHCPQPPAPPRGDPSSPGPPPYWHARHARRSSRAVRHPSSADTPSHSERRLVRARQLLIVADVDALL
jgi:hypothetical protein